MFIRQRGSSHQVIETYRQGGKVKQRVLANLGSCTTLAEAIEQWPRHIAYLAASLAHWEYFLREGLTQEVKYPDHEYKMLHGQFRKDGKKIIKREVAHWQRLLAHERENLEHLKALDRRSMVATRPTERPRQAARSHSSGWEAS
jgi:hypothetical protein